MTPRLRRILVHAALWLALSLITTSQGVLTYLATGGQVHVTPLVLLNLAVWLPWALLSPIILATARRYPLSGPRWSMHALAHLALNAILAVVAAVLYRALRFAIGMPPRDNYALVIASGLNTALLTYWGLVAIAHAGAYYRRTREREQRAVELDRQLTQARLDALRAQIHPHFLFNTLHAIASRIRVDARGAEDMLGALGELLRVNLRAAPGNEVPLDEELALTEQYLGIQRARFGDRLRVERHIDPLACAQLVPVLVLQPLVENAIEHGIAQRLSGGTLRIEARVDGTTLRLTVSDDGDANGGAPIDASQWHVGLTNTLERLRTLYGDQQSLTIAPGPLGGMSTVITIPVHRAPSPAP